MLTKQNAAAFMPGVWVLCLLLCLAIDFFYFPPHPSFPDEQRFLASAAHWLSNGEFLSNNGRAWEMPLPSMIFAAIRWIAGGDEVWELYSIRFIQALLVVLQSWLAFRLTRLLFPAGWAPYWAGVIVAFYPFFLFYQGLALSETLFDTALLSFFAVLYRWSARGCRIGGALICVMLLGATATYTRATLTILPPLLPAIAAWSRKCSIRHVLVVALVGSALYAGALSPWWIRNYLLFDAFVPFVTSSSSVLYLGNNPANLVGDNDWSKDGEQDVVSRIEAMPGELDRQNAYSQAAKAYIKAYPVRMIDRSLHKLKRFWNIIPNADRYNTGLLSIISAISFGPIFILSIIGLFINRTLWRPLLPVYSLIGYFTVVHCLTVGSLRYRLPLEAFLIILAAMAVSSLSTAVASRFRRTRR